MNVSASHAIRKRSGAGSRPYHSGTLIRIGALSHHITWLLGTRCSKSIPLTFVIGYPKSGTSWASQLLSDYLQLPFPRYSILPVTFPAIVHGHRGVWNSYPRAMYVVRDPRDAMVSRYFYSVRRHEERPGGRRSRRFRKLFPGSNLKDDVQQNLPVFIEDLMTRSLTHGMNWAQHVRTYLNRRNDRVGLLRYEKLLDCGPAHLAYALEEMTGEPADVQCVQEAVDRCSFARQSGRKPGQEDRSSFLRNGQAGDWRNHFSREAASVLDRYCGEVMREMGYIDSRDWVKECPLLAEMT